MSKVEGSITQTIEANISKFNSAKTQEEIVITLKDILNSNNIDTKASRRLVSAVERAKGFAQALFAVYNSLLYGQGLGVVECTQSDSKTSDDY